MKKLMKMVSIKVANIKMLMVDAYLKTVSMMSKIYLNLLDVGGIIV
jgi:hypothetical protein